MPLLLYNRIGENSLLASISIFAITSRNMYVVSLERPSPHENIHNLPIAQHVSELCKLSICFFECSY